jgi:hypothetical protein
MLSNAP